VPATLSFPGVYIEEVPSGVRAITGVATSITAFVGRALRGPVEDPVTIFSYGDFERTFGGLWRDSALGYAVNAYFQNGGSVAVIARLYQPATGTNPKASITAGSLTLEAANEGAWGANLSVTIDLNVKDDAATRLGLTTADLFNLTVTDTAPGGATEVFRNLSLKDSARRIDRVLAAESALLAWKGAFPTTVPAMPTAGTTAAGASSDGAPLSDTNNFTPSLASANKKGLFCLDKVDLFNLLCIPPHVMGGEIEATLIASAAGYCEGRRAMFLIDPPLAWTSVRGVTGAPDPGTTSKNSAVFFPRLRQPDPLRENRLDDFVPSGAVAGIFARTDAQRGVWKAPAGIEATLTGVPQLSVSLTDLENGALNPLGVNCLRALPAAGRVVWGSRTRQGDDRLASEWKYIPVRRLSLFIEESLFRGTQWVVFEPNDEPLWSQIRLNVGAFMQGLFRQGAFQGKTPREAYVVKCDSETTTQADINLGIVNIAVGFAPLKPAEFVVLRIQQIAGALSA
jgi:uncharacterized protein